MPRPHRAPALGALAVCAVGGAAEWPAPPYVRPPRFLAEEAEAANEHLREQGYVVYRDVITAAEVEIAMSLLWDFFEGLSPEINRQRPRSLNQASLDGLFGSGIFAACGAGQSALLWYLRGRPRVREVFGGIWGAEELLTSFDSPVTFRHNDSWVSKKPWYHWDLNPLRWKGTGLPMVQGYLSLTRGVPEAGGLVLVPGSHRAFRGLSERYRPALEHQLARTGNADHYVDFMRMDPEVLDSLEQGAVVLHLEPGDFAIWDGRTAHCNRGPWPGWRPSRLPRAGALVTMAPRRNASAAVLAARREALCHGVTTSHWPSEFVPMNQPKGGSRLQDKAAGLCVFPGPPELSAAQLQLAGLSAREAEEWLRDGSKRCPGVEYPTHVKPLLPVWSSQVVL